MNSKIDMLKSIWQSTKPWRPPKESTKFLINARYTVYGPQIQTKMCHVTNSLTLRLTSKIYVTKNIS